MSTTTPNDFDYYPLPFELFTDEKYKHISSGAKILFGILLDLSARSKEKGWVDNDGREYVEITRSEIAQIMKCGNKKVTSLFSELDSVSLVERTQYTPGKVSITYVNKIGNFK